MLRNTSIRRTLLTAPNARAILSAIAATLCVMSAPLALMASASAHAAPALLTSMQTAPPSRPAARPPTQPGQQPGRTGQAGQRPGQATQAPQVIRIEPPVIELGRVAPSTHHPVLFTLRNISNQPQKIMSVKPSCKCTTLESIAGRTLAPGATLRIEATMDAPGVPGAKDANLFIAVEGLESALIATIRCMVVMPIEATPPYVDIRGGKLRTTTTVSAIDGKPFRVISAGGQPPVYADAKGEPVPAPMQPQSSYVLVSDFTKVPTAELMQYWVVETDRDDCALVPVEVRHEVTGVRFDATAPQRRWLFGGSLINAGRLEVGEAYDAVVEFSQYDPRENAGPLRTDWGTVKQVRSLSSLATVELKETDTRGDKVVVRFRVTPTTEAAGKCIYLPVEITTGSGSGRCYVIASVRVRAEPAPTGEPKEDAAPKLPSEAKEPTAPKSPAGAVGGSP